jgi:predicted RNase H-like HicB family nuclease
LYGVVIPDLPGCTSAGKTIDAAYRHAIEAVRLWVEDTLEDGEKLPRPRSLMELAADREVRRALAAGAALIMVPVVIKVGRPKKKRRRYSLEQLLARLIGDWRCACF